jgi:RNA polymerase sigma-70 factor (ECF subfamily)
VQPDDVLIQQVLSGDTQAFGQLVTRYQPLVLAVCRQLLAEEHDALDAAQDTFLRAYGNLRQLHDRRQLGLWLRRVARTVCLNRLKGRGSERAAGPRDADLDPIDVPDCAPGPVERAEAAELARAVTAAIARLPRGYREPVQLFHLEGAGGAEIAERLGLPAGCVRTRLSRARDWLRADLARFEPIESGSRGKQGRGWLPLRFSQQETMAMQLRYEATKFRLLRGEEEVTIRQMTREDIPALRRFDTELAGTIPDSNAQRPPGSTLNDGGGPWSDDEWLREHFDKYQRAGNITLLTLDDAGRVVGFADLWAAGEPEPFGPSLDVECIDYFREYFLAGLETVLLSQAEDVARAAGLPALDIGTNTCSGEYVSLRRFGMKVFYEYDSLVCRCGPVAGPRAERRDIAPGDEHLAGLIKVDHWSPTGFIFRNEDEPCPLVELTWRGRRAVVELWRYDEQAQRGKRAVPPNAPNRAELYVPPESLRSGPVLTEVLAECAALAGELGARQIELPCPSDISIERGRLDVLDRQFAFAWLRKRLT